MCENPGIITDPDKPCPDKGNLGTGLGAGPGNGQCVTETTQKIGHITACNNCISGSDRKYFIDRTSYCGNAYDLNKQSPARKNDIVAFNYGPSYKNYTCESPAIVTNPDPLGGKCN